MEAEGVKSCSSLYYTFYKINEKETKIRIRDQMMEDERERWNKDERPGTTPEIIDFYKDPFLFCFSRNQCILPPLTLYVNTVHHISSSPLAPPSSLYHSSR
ncbi:hypothetical protein V6Z11_A11G069800 [Gossypium hirsutum]